MKRYRTRGLSTLVVTLLLAASGAARAQRPDAKAAGLDPGKLGELRAEMDKLVKAGQIAGVVTLVAHQGRVGSLEAVGFRDLEARAPMRPDSLFRIASMTKIATAIGILMLSEDGKLAVEDPVERHLPEFRGLQMIQKRSGNTVTLVPPARPITIRDLLTHTSGMRCQPPPGFADLGAKKDRTLAEAVVAFSQQPLEGPPGEVWKYCGTAFDTLGRIIEVAGKRPYEDFLAERLFRPLGMKDTTFRPSRAQFARLAAVYKKRSGDPGGGVVRAENQGPAPGDPIRFPSPGGGLYSTASDYARMLQMLLDGGAVRGRLLLKPDTIGNLSRIHFTSKEKVGFSPGLGMGLGVQVVMTPADVTEVLSPGSFGHGGAYGTQAWVDPAKETIYVLMIQRQDFGNGDMSDVRRIFQRVAKSAIVEPKAAGNSIPVAKQGPG